MCTCLERNKNKVSEKKLLLIFFLLLSLALSLCCILDKQKKNINVEIKQIRLLNIAERNERRKRNDRSQRKREYDENISHNRASQYRHHNDFSLLLFAWQTKWRILQWRQSICEHDGNILINIAFLWPSFKCNHSIGEKKRLRTFFRRLRAWAVSVTQVCGEQ